jgi:hypothetical protein
LYFYWARLVKGTPRPIGCRDLKWVKPGELLNYNFPPADAELILELARPEERFSD